MTKNHQAEQLTRTSVPVVHVRHDVLIDVLAHNLSELLVGVVVVPWVPNEP